MRTIRTKIFHTLLPVLLAFMLNACASWLPDTHHIEIQQGNIIKQAERDALQLGMTRSDVKSLLGEAILQDPFHPNRWDYIYKIKSDRKENRFSRLTVYFESNRLTTIDDSGFNPEE